MTWALDQQRKIEREKQIAQEKCSHAELFTAFWGRKCDGFDLAQAYGAETGRKFSLLSQKDKDEG